MIFLYQTLFITKKNKLKISVILYAFATLSERPAQMFYYDIKKSTIIVSYPELKLISINDLHMSRDLVILSTNYPGFWEVMMTLNKKNTTVNKYMNSCEEHESFSAELLKSRIWKFLICTRHSY